MRNWLDPRRSQRILAGLSVLAALLLIGLAALTLLQAQAAADPATEIDAGALASLAQSATALMIASALAAGVLLLTALGLWRQPDPEVPAARAVETAGGSPRAERERQLHAVGEMSAVLAHEIRNPVTSLKGHAQLLVERLPEAGRERGKAERIVSEAVRLEVLSADLLDFTKTGPLELRAVDPAKLLRDAAQAVDSERIRVDTSGCPDSWSLDPYKMRQLLVNVLRNACQAAPDAELVEARVYAVDDRLHFVVLDRGEGLPAGDEERIFEPFFTTRAKGTGLGLGVARRITDMHGGTIVARNRAAGGARFEISIPAS
ncbi:MAG: ATP-binding protein [Acidobacteriota bacterium]